jgi:hypothetical protein
MKQLRWAFFQLILWVFELKLWMDGMPWEEVRFIVAERLKDLAKGWCKTLGATP